MKTIPFIHPAVGILALFLLSPEVRAQHKEFTVSSGDWHTSGNWSPSGAPTTEEVRIGTTTTNRTANISSADATSGPASIGYGSGHFGTVNVSNARLWNLGVHTLSVGYGGTGMLLIGDGGSVSNTGAFIGTSGLGEVTVTGVGSTWTDSSDINVGHGGIGILRIEDGGSVLNNSAHLGIGTNAMGEVTVSGANSSWTNNGDIYLGGEGTGTLSIEAGALVTSNWTSIGYLASSNGAVTVTGTDSQWANTSSIFVGYYGTGTLTVEDGGQVSTSILYASLADLHGDGIISAKGAVLDGPEILFDQTQGPALSIAFGNGGELQLDMDGSQPFGVGYRGTGAFSVTDGATLTTTSGHLGEREGSVGTATVTGDDSTWSNSSGLYVGSSGGGNLLIENGGAVLNTLALLGESPSGVGEVTVSGTGSTWTSSWGIRIGVNGIGTLRIEDGGIVSNDGAFLGVYPGSKGEVAVAGDDSNWTSGYFYIADSGTGILRIEDGGSVSTNWAIVGASSNSVGEVTVTGANSTWTNHWGFEVGQSGTAALHIEDGGLVTSEAAFIGNHASGNGAVTVTGTDSLWQNSGAIHVGYNGNGTLTVEDGGHVSTSILYASLADLHGDGIISAKGAVLDGPEILFDQTQGPAFSVAFGNGGELQLDMDGSQPFGVGYHGTGALSVTDGATLTTTSGHLGELEGSVGTATVTGGDSTWSNSSELHVGLSGTGNLLIENGGGVLNTWTYLGYNSSGVGEVTVSDAGSSWTSSGSIRVGLSGTGTLRIEDGGSVSNTGAYIGTYLGSAGEVTVSGDDSTWTNSSGIYIGVGGTGTLLIEDGGTVSNTLGFIGRNSDSFGTVTVTGGGSTWINSSDLVLGGESLWTETTATGELTIQDGGSVWIGGTLRIFDGDSVTLDGGTIRFDGYNRNAGGTFDYQSGMVQLAGNRTVGSDAAISDLFGATPSIGAGKGLTIEGIATLDTTLTLSGGTFTASIINNLANLNFLGGTITVNGALTGDLVIPESGVLTGMSTIEGDLLNSGQVSPGNSPGTLTVEGDYTQTFDGTLIMELGGLVQGTEYDFLDVHENLTLGGTLELASWGGFQAEGGDSFQLFSFGTIEGSFDTINAFALGEGLSWDYSQLNSLGIVSVIPEPSTMLLVLAAGGAWALRRKRQSATRG